ncbi:hypothetical protein M569_13734, partial [Genlisea aurea]
SGGSPENGFVTLGEFIGENNVGDELFVLFSHLEFALKRIAAIVASPFNSSLAEDIATGSETGQRDKPKPL